MTQKQFLSGGEWQEQDTVIYGEKAFTITKILRGYAHMVHRDGTGEPTEKRVKLSELPQKTMTVKPSPAGVDDVIPDNQIPEYEPDQRLANGWVIEKPTVRGKYMVMINGSRQEMPARAIAAAERDFAKVEAARLAREAAEAEMHKQAEREALAEMAEMYGSDKPLEKLEMPTAETDEGSEKAHSATLPPLPEIPDEARVMAMMEALEGVVSKVDAIQAQTKKINALEDRLLTKIGEVSDALDERMRKIERQMVEAGPVATGRSKVTVETLRHNLTAAADKALADKLNNGWRILTSTDHPAESIIRLVREQVADEQDTPDRKVMQMPDRVLVDGDDITVTDVTEKYAHLTPMTAKMAQRWDETIDANTRRIMGDDWYAKNRTAS